MQACCLLFSDIVDMLVPEALFMECGTEIPPTTDCGQFLSMDVVVSLDWAALSGDANGFTLRSVEIHLPISLPLL